MRKQPENLRNGITTIGSSRTSLNGRNSGLRLSGDDAPARIRQYVWDAKVTPFIWMWTPIDYYTKSI